MFILKNNLFLIFKSLSVVLIMKTISLSHSTKSIMWREFILCKHVHLFRRKKKFHWKFIKFHTIIAFIALKHVIFVNSTNEKCQKRTNIVYLVIYCFSCSNSDHWFFIWVLFTLFGRGFLALFSSFFLMQYQEAIKWNHLYFVISFSRYRWPRHFLFSVSVSLF